jgi:polyisoprenoid-binding protein YceI
MTRNRALWLARSAILFGCLPAMAGNKPPTQAAGIVPEVAKKTEASQPQAKSSKVVDLTVKSGKVEFEAVANPSFLKIVGKGESPSGSASLVGTQAKGKFEFPLGQLKTGLSLRDKHMKEKFLQTDKYPNAVFELTELKLPSTYSGGKAKFEGVTFEGLLTLHGVQKKIAGIATVEFNDDGIVVQPVFTVKMSEFGIEKPSFAGMSVEDPVKVSLNLNMVAKAQ